MNSIEIHSSDNLPDSVKFTWNGFIADKKTDLSGFDATATYEWFDSLYSAFPAAASTKVITILANEEIVLIMPIFEFSNSFLGKDLKATTDLYGGRCGLLVQSNQYGAIEDFLKGIGKAFSNWRSLQITTVHDNIGTNELRRACRKMKFPFIEGTPMPSPYYPILDNGQAFNELISKDLKQRLKSSTKKLNAAGKVSYKIYTEEDSSETLLAEILQIERQSWKHEAGTAISNNPQQISFYQEMFPRAMRAKCFFAQLMYMDDKPAAYNFGLVRDGVFCSLKVSHIQALHKLTPSYVLNNSVIDNLRQSGINTYDCMGKPEQHKLNWSSATRLYSRTAITIFNKNPAGVATYLSKKLKIKLNSNRQKDDGCSAANDQQ
jgi:hypothetical protein